MHETLVRSLGQEDPLEMEMATHSSTLAWKIPWAEKPEELQSRKSLSAHTHTHIHALVKGVGRNIISYIKTKLEGSCFLSYFFFPLNFLPLSMFSQVPSPPTPTPPHLTLPPISFSSGLYFLKKTFIYLSQCVQGRSGSIIIMKYKITQACFSFLGLLQASRKFSRTEGAAGREKATPVPFSPQAVNPRLSCLQTLSVALFRQGSLDPLQTSCQLMFCSLM